MPSTVKVKYHRQKEGRIAPLLATFIQGPPPTSSMGLGKEGSPEFKKLKFSLSTKGSSSSERVLTASNSEIKFSSASTNTTNRKPYKYAIGVYNSSTGQVDIYETENNGSVYGLDIEAVERRSDAVQPDDLEGLNAKLRRDMLIDAFGSRKKKMMEKSKAANIVDVEAVAAAEDVGAALRSSTKNSAEAVEGKSIGSSKYDDVMKQSRARLLPPYNETTSNVEEAYPLDGMISSSSAEAISGLVNSFSNAVISNDAKELGALLESHARHSSHLKSRIPKLMSTISGFKGMEDHDDITSQKTVLKRCVRALLYLRYLIALYTGPQELRPRVLTARPTESTQDESESLFPETYVGIPSLRFVPDNIREVLLNSFTEKRHSGSVDPTTGSDVSYARTQESNDKLLTYIAALALYADRFKLDIRHLAADLKVTPTKLLHYFRELGCNAVAIRSGNADESQEAVEDEPEATVSSNASISSYIVSLKAPLTFPKLKVGRKAR